MALRKEYIISLEMKRHEFSQKLKEEVWIGEFGYLLTPRCRDNRTGICGRQMIAPKFLWEKAGKVDRYNELMVYVRNKQLERGECDHKVACKLGGENIKENATYICSNCNNQKRAKTIEENQNRMTISVERMVFEDEYLPDDMEM